MSANIRVLVTVLIVAGIATDRALAMGTTSDSESPYTGTAVSLPGTIQVENFDEGGEDVAYHDTTSGNTGGAYRSTDVDIEVSSEGDYEVAWIDAGEWLNYSVVVGSSGTYTLQLRVASLAGGTLHVGFNGSSLWTPVVLPATGGWQNWTTVSLPATLTEGPQLLTLYFDTGGFNIRFITVDAATPEGKGVADADFIGDSSSISADIPPLRTATFSPSADDAINVSSYSLAIFNEGADPSTAIPVASQNIGKPDIVEGEMLANITSLFTSLSAGRYFATVMAIGPGGNTTSEPSNIFSR